MISKRPIYNQQMACVAYEVLLNNHNTDDDIFAEKLITFLSDTDHDLPLFIPYELKPLIESDHHKLPNPVILKLNANKINTEYGLDEIKNSLFSIALIINNTQQLAWLNFSEYLGLSETILCDANMSKVIQYSHNNNRKIIAYGIPHHQLFSECQSMKVDYFCGDFLFEPQIDSEKEIASNELTLLELINLLQQDDVHIEKISEIILADPILSYQLLKLVNSPAYMGYSKIESIDQAIARLGLGTLKRWVTLFSMKNVSNKPTELLESALIRANMASHIAKLIHSAYEQSAYTAGLLSILDSLLNRPIADLLSRLTLSEEITDALVHREGPLGELINTVIAYEEGHWDAIDVNLVDDHALSEIYIESLNMVSSGKLAWK